MHGRGYPDGIIQSLTSALLCFANKHQLQSLPPDSKNGHLHLDRKEARVQRALDAIAAMELEKSLWPQTVPEETSKSCFAAYRNSIQYTPLSVCASCSAEDRLRTGIFHAFDKLPPMDNLRIQNQYILDHAPPSQFKFIDARLDGLLLEPKGIRTTAPNCGNVQVYLCAQCHSSLTIVIFISLLVFGSWIKGGFYNFFIFTYIVHTGFLCFTAGRRLPWGTQ